MIDSSWQEVGSLDQLNQETPQVFTHDNEQILIAYLDGEWTAHTLRCPHKGAMMRPVDCVDGQLACPFHGWCFDLRDGGTESHGYIDLLDYELTVEDNKLYVKTN